ncbi:MAG: 3-isopropylmalate dehydratase small subunit [Planctomycetaceae bacterium]|nr:3-isopropylmalate dehydratase small subunit [Planctomycetaceae bacterium]
METTIGAAFLLRDNVDTDQILPGYAMSYPPEKLGEAALAGSEIPDFAKQVKPGDVVIAGENFGCGSSREQAPVALKASGVAAVVAGSFARIFRRNAINIGLPVVTSPEAAAIRAEAKPGDRFQVDIENARLVNTTQGKTYPLTPLAQSSLETLRAGGLMNKVREKLLARGEKLHAPA